MLNNITNNKSFNVLFTLFLVMFLIIPTKTKPNKVLEWKGQMWEIRSEYGNPGNNLWNGSGAWIDNQNRMHLNLTKIGSKWYCTEIDSREGCTYGIFTWSVASPVYTFDRNIVLGLYTYKDDNNELDIEASRWGYKNGDNLDFSVQPCKQPNTEKTFKVNNSGENTTYILEWRPEYVKFSSIHGGKIINDWTCTQRTCIPKDPETISMNLWLIKPPSDGNPIECIISDFSYTPIT